MKSAHHANPVAPHDDIAIVGMACIFPGAADLRQYWQNIVAKVDAVSEPTEAWGAEFFYDPTATANDRIYCKRGGYLKELAEFDPLPFGVMPSSLRGAEPGHFLALRAAYEALNDAGYLGQAIDGERVEVILGKGAQFGPADVNAIQHGIVIDQTLRLLKQLHPEHSDAELAAIKQELKAGLAPFNAETVPGLVSSIVTGRINNRLDFMGANYTVDAACASSLIAIERGIQDLRTGKCDMALAGGIEPCIPPLMLMVFCQINALSRQGRIRPFAKDAAGTLLGEGVGIVVLKRKADAERDQDRIYAVIKGVGVSSDGRGAGLLAPRLEGEALAITRAYQDAAIDPQTVGLIEAHGTGVPLGDVTEVQALSRVFGPRNQAHPWCALGSVKSMVSHLVHAAGVAGLIKAALALHHKVLPPTLHCDVINPELELEKTPFYINSETRPWIHGGDHPRRAGVNSFGFGGINSHAILEEYAAAATPEALSSAHQWESEIFIIEGESRAELVEACLRLLNFLASQPAVEMKDLAYSLNCPLPQSACRLAIVAGSVDELSKKLAQGMKKLAAPDCARIKDRSGIFFFEQPLGREGKLAFMFPGYGSEYVNMLADLCMHFPEVRSHFDNLDKVFLHSRREPLPSQVLFPPPMAQATAEASAEELFAKVAFGSSAMCTGGLALLDLLTRLELRPDAVVGHSNGEFAALLAAGAIDLEGEEQFIEHALRAQSLYDSFAEQIPTAKVLAIGGGDPALVASLIAESGGALQMTIDNCPHQVVVCGPAEAIASATEYLQARGVICTVMPFDHAVHSPLFQPICDQIAAAHHSLNIVPPRIPVYSCTTAQAHAPDPAQIRPLIMNHLARPVRFRETIENMYEAGVRLFVEVGPKSNLTSFVNDTLSDRRFVAVPSNAANRSGITQLNHLIGLLVAHHVTMRLDHLYARRSPNRVSLDSAGERSPSRSAKPRSVKLSLEYPLLKLRSDGRASLPASSATTEEMVSEPIHKANGQTRPTGIGPRPAVQTVPPGYRNGNGHKTHLYPSAHGHAFNDKRQTRGNGRGARARVMNEYLQTMGQFLAMQQAVVGTFLAESAPASHGNGPRKTLPAAAAPHAPAPQGPFRLVVQSLVAGRELAATCHFDLSEHLFLRDHTLGRSPAATDETLLALPVVPLTINMEMMAQAASLLVPGKRLVAMKQLRSYRWIDVDERGRTLALTAKVKSAAPAEIEVRVTGADGPSRADESSLLLEGTMIFADAYPSAPRPEALADRPRRPYHLRPEQYYDSMFHGQCFRSVVSVDQFDRDSIQATLKNPPHAQLFRSADSAGLLTAPVLLDGAGQTIGFWLWTLDGFEEGAATFPVGFESLHFYAPPEYGSEPITCAARIDQLAHERTRADIDLIGPRGELLARLRAWEDVRAMGWTQRFNRFILSPSQEVYSQPWPQPISSFQAATQSRCYTVADGPGGLWPHVLAAMILNRQEREAFARLKKPERNRRQWLLGRLAVKDAARVYIRDHHRLNLCPADIEIITDEYGRPALAPRLIEKVGADLAISISHSQNRAAAVVGPRQGPGGIGIEIKQLTTPHEGLEEAALTATEREWLAALPAPQRAEWLLRMWCAKEAVAKALGLGLSGHPRNLVIADLQVETGEMIVRITGGLAEQLPQFSRALLTARSGREADLIYAVSQI